MDPQVTKWFIHVQKWVSSAIWNKDNFNKFPYSPHTSRKMTNTGGKSFDHACELHLCYN